MTDRGDLATRPDPEFERRLEADLRDRIFGAAQVDDEAVEPTHRSLRRPTNERLEVRRARRRDGASPWAQVAAAGTVMVGIAAVWFVLRPGDAPSADVPAPANLVTFDVQWPPLDGLEHTVCNDGTGGASYESAQDHWCWRSFFGEVDLSGDLAGVALWTMRGNVGVPGDARDATVELPAAFNGTYIVKADVAGCGSGEFMIAEPLTFVGWESGQFVGTWQIIPGSGRGDLVSITGSGVVAAATPDDPIPDAPRTHIGTVACD